MLHRTNSYFTLSVPSLAWVVVLLALQLGQAPQPSTVPAVELAWVPADLSDLDQPSHGFLMGRFEVRNDQWVAFLNDARAHLSDERGAFLYFDVDSGDVFLHDATQGVIGTAGGGIHVFRIDANPYVTQLGSGTYATVAGFENHPATGISWYGAAKFCNWLTLWVGQDASERAYVEAPASNPLGWRPATISEADWSHRDLLPTERSALLGKRGFRLPMDEGDRFREWYKAAAWNPQMRAYRAFGFGRDEITGADANFRESGDPFDDATTPVGYYDGSSHLGTYLTRSNENPYGLFDLSGNVWEWVQDHASDPAHRRLMGGSFRSASSSLAVADYSEREASAAHDSTGFRVALVQEVRGGLALIPDADLNVEGYWGGPFLKGSAKLLYRAINVTSEPIALSVEADAPWARIDPDDVATIAPGVDMNVGIIISPPCDAEGDLGDVLSIGAQEVLATVTSSLDGSSTHLLVRYEVIEPLSIAPVEPVRFSMVYGLPTTEEVSYELVNLSDSAVRWSVQLSDLTDSAYPSPHPAWLAVEATEGPFESINPGAHRQVTVAIEGNQASALPIGEYVAEIRWMNECTGTEFFRRVELEVLAPLSIRPIEPVSVNALCGRPFEPVAIIVRNEVGLAVDWVLETDPPNVLSLNVSTGRLSPGHEFTVIASPGSTAATLPVGRHPIVLTLRQSSTGFAVQRTVTVDVTALRVEPEEAVRFRGPSGGPFEPWPAEAAGGFRFVVHNADLKEFTWTAVFQETTKPPSGRNWLRIVPDSGTILEPDGAVEVDVLLGPQADRLPPGIYTGTLTFSHGSAPPGCAAARLVALVVGPESISPLMALAPGDHFQQAGPTHSFRIGRYEVTNQEFVRFLNDTLFSTDERRRAFLDHGQPPEGLVRLAGDGSAVFDASLGGDVEVVNGHYAAREGRENHPVVGVSWFGALKFCNWMTLVQGMSDPDQRAYTEGPRKEDWTPVLSDRAALVRGVRGFRLPMDDGVAGPSPYSEWHKAASRGGLTPAGLPIFGVEYGFGRSGLGAPDANFLAEVGPLIDGTTPVGFFDGRSRLADGVTVTRDTFNGYGLYDACGNVAEWVQDVGALAGERGIRGGHFGNAGGSPLLRTDFRGSLAADRAYPFVGLRIAQALEPQPLAVTIPVVRSGGFAGGPITPTQFTIQLTNPGDYTHDDLSVTSSTDWLVSAAAPIRSVLPNDTTDAILRIEATAARPGPSPPPAGLVLVPGTVVAEPVGPDYDFWIGRTEVTNREFAAFLNDGLADARRPAGGGPRSQHMYFDLDSGNVYIHDRAAGEAGTAAPTPSVTTKLYDATQGRIRYFQDRFQVADGLPDHPVVGVTWYGALKYCNWLSIKEGIPADLLAYLEAPSPDLQNWRPNLETLDRRAWIENTLGYRLPMDEEQTGPSPFNEWYKAAAWDDGAGRNSVYAFGRDSLTPADANYLDSGDTIIEGTTPVRFFDGANLRFVESSTCAPRAAEDALTTDSANPYRLYDLCGNVAEWVQDVGDDLGHRTVRGGGWRTPAESALLTNRARGSRAAASGFDDVGFRVVRQAGHVASVTVRDRLAGREHAQSFIVDLAEPLTITPAGETILSGRYGDDLPITVGAAVSYDVMNRSESAMNWRVEVNTDWLDVGLRTTRETDGVLAGGAVITLDAYPLANANRLAPGSHAAEIRLWNESTGTLHVRRLRLDLAPPVEWAALDAEPREFTGAVGGPFETPLAVRTFRMSNHLASVLTYRVRSDAPWAVLESAHSLTATVPAGGTRLFFLSVGPAAEAMGVGVYPADVELIYADPRNGGAGGAESHLVALRIADPLTIRQADEPWRVRAEPGAKQPPRQRYELVVSGPGSADAVVETDVPWLTVKPDFVKVIPGTPSSVWVSLNDIVWHLPNGEYTGHVTFANGATAAVQCRTVVLSVSEALGVLPFDGFLSRGVQGAVPFPTLAHYRLENDSLDEPGPISWRASLHPPESDWLRINGLSGVEGLLPDGQSVTLILSIDRDRVRTLPAGDFAATLEIVDQTNDATSRREVHLTLVAPRFPVPESLVVPASEATTGPAYPYAVAKSHVTNAQFAEFLNDALNHPHNERGQYMYFDTVGGGVYVNSAVSGEVGPSASGRQVRMFSPSLAGRMSWGADGYRVADSPIDYSQHPVAGVSWYGALKYCNWLTIDQGLLLQDRCYTEGTDADLTGWRPVTISAADWAQRDLNDTERENLVRGLRGFRLPMDDGADNASPPVDTMDRFNEWFQAAAWNPHSMPPRATTFGFGRNTLTGADANFQNSGDPFDNGTTPVGYFDAVNANAYGLSDMSGNLYQWLQDRYSPHPGNLAFRSIRGGSWNDPIGAASLLAASRTFTRPERVDAQIGFRVLRTLLVPTGDGDGDGDLDGEDMSALVANMGGPGPVEWPVTAAPWTAFDSDSDGDVDLRDVARFQNRYTGPF